MQDERFDWCGPTAQLSRGILSGLIERTRRVTGPTQKKPTDSQAPLSDPWFEESKPVIEPGHDPSGSTEGSRERKERTQIPKVVVRQAVYPVYRSATTTVVRWTLGIGVLLGGAAVALTTW